MLIVWTVQNGQNNRNFINRGTVVSNISLRISATIHRLIPRKISKSFTLFNKLAFILPNKMYRRFTVV